MSIAYFANGQSTSFNIHLTDFLLEIDDFLSEKSNG
jgi:hypothetical protein